MTTWTQELGPYSPFAPFMAGSRQIVGGSLFGVTLAAGTTKYSSLSPANGLGTDELTRSWIAPYRGTFSLLQIITGNAQPADGSLVVTLRVGGVSKSLALTIPASSVAGKYSQETISVVVEAGDVVTLKYTNNSVSASAQIESVGLMFQTPQ